MGRGPGDSRGGSAVRNEPTSADYSAYGGQQKSPGRMLSRGDARGVPPKVNMLNVTSPPVVVPYSADQIRLLVSP